MSLPSVREPSIDELRDRADWSDGMFSSIEGDLGAERIAERQVYSYLWEHWKVDLQQEDYNWQKFKSDTSTSTSVVQRWAAGKTEWREVVARIVRRLDVEN